MAPVSRLNSVVLPLRGSPMSPIFTDTHYATGPYLPTYLWLLKHYRPGALATFFLTQPIFGVVIANLVTGDPLTVDLLVASLAVALGIGLTIR